MRALSKYKEKRRFKKTLADELLEYHFERYTGKNKHNALSWRVILEEKIQPHTDILCDFSRWLLDRGWSRDVVEELFFVVLDEKNAGSVVKLKKDRITEAKVKKSIRSKP